MAVSRRAFFPLLTAFPLMRGSAAAAVALRLDDGVLRVVAPLSMHVIEGTTLRRLQDGVGLVFSLQLSLSSDQFRTIARRQVERYVVSYDLWEERFAVFRLGTVKQQATHLSRDAAERWMFDHAGIPLYGMQSGAAHWLRAEMRADDPRDSGNFLLDPALTLTRLVEWFGRSQRGHEQRWAMDFGPFRPSELER